MATYHYSANIISRSSGRSSVAAAAYRAAEQLVDQRQSLEHYYVRRSGVLHTEVMLPSGAQNGSGSASLSRGGRKRKDAQLAREVVVALPHEVSDKKRLELVRGFDFSELKKAA